MMCIFRAKSSSSQTYTLRTFTRVFNAFNTKLFSSNVEWISFFGRVFYLSSICESFFHSLPIYFEEEEKEEKTRTQTHTRLLDEKEACE